MVTTIECTNFSQLVLYNKAPISSVLLPAIHQVRVLYAGPNYLI